MSCQKHNCSKWALVCGHLLTGASRQWQHVTEAVDEESPDGCEGFLLCPEHIRAYYEDGTWDHADFMPLCMECIRRVRRRSEQGRNMADSWARWLAYQKEFRREMAASSDAES
jgi:hypothetical protein